MPAGYTYFGQFLDHDITFDKTVGLPSTSLTPEEIESGRSLSLDLDSVYGRGPGLEAKPFYEGDLVRLRIGETTPAGGVPGMLESLVLPNDLPRGHAGAALREATIGDPRNDENLAVAQTHLAFLKFHNVVVARLAESGLTGAALFNQARRSVCMHYQWIVLHDFLPRVIETILQRIITTSPQVFNVSWDAEPTMPVEFSVAAYRFGHSMIRDEYSWNRFSPNATLNMLFTFSGLSGDMAGASTLPTNWCIDWRRFYDFTGVLEVEQSSTRNKTRTIDTALAIQLKELPEFQGSGHKAALAVRNLLRGRAIGLLTRQDVADELNVPKMHPEQIRRGTHGRILSRYRFDVRTPLWY